MQKDPGIRECSSRSLVGFIDLIRLNQSNYLCMQLRHSFLQRNSGTLVFHALKFLCMLSTGCIHFDGAPKRNHRLTMLAQHRGGHMLPVDAQVMRDGPRKAQRVLLRPHTDHPITPKFFGEHLDRELNRIADDDKKGIRHSLSAYLSDLLEQADVSLAPVATIDQAGMFRYTCTNNNNVALDIFEIRHHLNLDPRIVERVHQIDPAAQQPCGAARNAVRYQLKSTALLE